MQDLQETRVEHELIGSQNQSLTDYLDRKERRRKEEGVMIKMGQHQTRPLT